MRKLLFILLSALSLMAVAQQKPKIAVYMTGEDPINEIVSNRLVDDFARGNEYTTVERTANFLAELSKEHAYERSGEVDDEQIAALGRQFNVQYVCVVSVLDVWNTEKYITARIIDTETAEVIASCSSNGSIQNSSELIGALNTLSDSFFKAMRSSKQDNAKKVAVYVSKTGNRDVDVVLGDQLVSGFARSGRYVAIERTNSFLRKLKEEQGYQQSGAVADDDLTRWGQQFGVQYVCVTKSTAWSGDYFITTRMVDVKTGEVVNSYKVEGRKLSNSRDVVRVAQEIAAELSKGTLAEQAEEERLRKEAEEAKIRVAEEARLRAEAEERARIQAEEDAKRRAEEEKQQRIDAKKNELRDYLKKGYIIVEVEGQKWMVCIEPIKEISGKEVHEGKSYYACGYNDWKIGAYYLFMYGGIYEVASDFLHYLNKTLPIVERGQDFWDSNGGDKRAIKGINIQRETISDNHEYLDGMGRNYLWKRSNFEANMGYPEYEFKMNNKKANALLVRKIR